VAQVVFSSWGRTVVDNRKGGEVQEAAFRLPTTLDGERSLAAFMGWDGIILFDGNVDVPAMAAEYMARVQTRYVCGKCTPGKKGTRVIMDALAAIVEGRGSEGLLDTITDLPLLFRTGGRRRHPLQGRLPRLHKRRQ
jgi:formate dehydrogenase beta subunit